MADVGGLGFSRQLSTLDEDYLANNLDISNTSSNVLTALNKDNSLVNLVNNLHNRRRNLEEVKSTQAPTLNSALDSNSLSFSLSRQSILYDAYCLGSEKKIASLIVGQSFYTSPAEAQTVASTEEIDTELEKIKELFAAGFIQQEDFEARIQSLNFKKAKAVAN